MNLYIVTRDGKDRSEPMPHNQCFAEILLAQGQSVDWAMKYEGWAVRPATEFDFDGKTKTVSLDFEVYFTGDDEELAAEVFDIIANVTEDTPMFLRSVDLPAPMEITISNPVSP
jgi:hypothetical protein